MDPIDQKRLELQFVNLISALAASAMQQLGKLVNPLSGKTEVNLDGAKSSIDLLEMLQAKTKGNLNKDEENLLKSTVSNLQLNYIDESSKPKIEAKIEGEKIEKEPKK